MRIVSTHFNSPFGGAEIAAIQPMSWAACLTGSLRAAGFDDISFIDAMTNRYGAGENRARWCALTLGVVKTAAITAAVCRAQTVLRIAQETAPRALSVRAKAPWIDMKTRAAERSAPVAFEASRPQQTKLAEDV